MRTGWGASSHAEARAFPCVCLCSLVCIHSQHPNQTPPCAGTGLSTHRVGVEPLFAGSLGAAAWGGPERRIGRS